MRRRAALGAGQVDISQTRSASFPTRVKDVLARAVCPRHLATLSVWRPGPQSARRSLASLHGLWLVGASGSCLSSLYRRARTEPSRRKQPVTVVAREAACFSWRSRHLALAVV